MLWINNFCSMPEERPLIIRTAIGTHLYVNVDLLQHFIIIHSYLLSPSSVTWGWGVRNKMYKMTEINVDSIVIGVAKFTRSNIFEIIKKGETISTLWYHSFQWIFCLSYIMDHSQRNTRVAFKYCLFQLDMLLIFLFSIRDDSTNSLFLQEQL